MNFKSCMNCTDRHMGCHDRCEHYIRDKAEHERVRELARREKEEYSVFSEMAKERNRKRKRRRF